MLATAGIVVTSTTYEWCYFLVVGVDFVSFISAGDIVPLVLAWLPQVLGSWFVFAFLYALLYGNGAKQDAALGPARDSVQDPDTSAGRSWKWNNILLWIMYGVVAIAILLRGLNVLFSPSSSYVTLLLSVLFGASVL